MRKIVVVFSAMLYVAVLAGINWDCKDDITGGPIDIVFPASNISYGKYVQPLFDRGCAYSGCHAGDSPPDGLNLEDYQDALSSDLGVIIPNDTTNSRIIWSIQGTHGAQRMPPDRDPLTPNQIKGIKQWILEGAKNN